MKKISKLQFIALVSLIILSSCNLFSSKKRILLLEGEIDSTSIKFLYETLGNAVKVAEKTDKPVFIYFTADGCGPCVKMERSVFTDSLVSDFINSNFVCVKSHRKRLSVSGIVTKEEEQLNKTIDLVMDKYCISGTPSFVIIDSRGNLIHKSIGYKEQDELIQFSKDALSNDRNYAAIKTKIENGDYSFETVKLYLEGTPSPSSFFKNIFGNDNQKIIDSYFKKQEKSEWSSTDNWLLINRYVDDFNSEQFQYLLHNTDLFYQLNNRIIVDKKLLSVISNYAFNGGVIENLNYPIAELIVKHKKLMMQNFDDINDYVINFNDIYLEYCYLFDYEVNNKCVEICDIFETGKNDIELETLEIAMNWMELLATHFENNPSYVDTYNRLQNLLAINKI